MTFKARVIFSGGEQTPPWSHDIADPTNEKEIEEAMRLSRSLGGLCLIECIRTDAHRDGRWHDAMAAEGLPTEFEVRPIDPALRGETHVVYPAVDR